MGIADSPASCSVTALVSSDELLSTTMTSYPRFTDSWVRSASIVALSRFARLNVQTTTDAVIGSVRNLPAFVGTSIGYTRKRPLAQQESVSSNGLEFRPLHPADSGSALICGVITT